VKSVARAKRAQQNSGWRAKTARCCGLRCAKAPRASSCPMAIAREMERPTARAATDQQASQTVTSTAP